MAETETVKPPVSLARLGPVPLTQPARFAFDNEQLALMKRTVARGADDNAFLLFLELIGRYKLDPFAGHAYLAKMPGQDGEPPTLQDHRVPRRAAVHREPHDDFNGMEGDVIYATDILERTREHGFVHTYAAIPAAERMKQDIVGAWARVYRGDRKPTFFLAPFKSYKRGNKSWTQYPDAMNLKVGESMALRKAYSITGLIPEDEVGARYDDRYGGVVEQDQPVEQEPDWGPDEDLAKRLQIAFGEANRIRPGSFLPQKVRLKMAGADQLKRTEILQEVTDFVLASGGSIPIEGEAVEEAAVVSESPAA